MRKRNQNLTQQKIYSKLKIKENQKQSEILLLVCVFAKD